MIARVPRRLITRLCEDLGVNPNDVETIELSGSQVRITELGRKGDAFMKRTTHLPVENWSAKETAAEYVPPSEDELCGRIPAGTLSEPSRSHAHSPASVCDPICPAWGHR